ncbi:MAG: carboxypeptidase regulatory-like domain-containing protein [Bryobacteraceae bacterium]
MSGTIVDQQSAAIPGAKIELHLPNGGAAVAVTTSSQAGLFFFASVNPGTYDLTVEATGFQKGIFRNLKVDSGRELSIGNLTMEVGALTEVVEVSEAVLKVQTTNAEVTTNITNEQVRLLPQLSRSPQALLQTQAGVTNNGRQVTTINGLRPSFVNITIDGINIQDNFIRQNTVDFQPNLLLTDQVTEVTLSTANASTATGAGAAQVNYVTPSGSNEYHGGVFWLNRNNKFAANNWFNNRDGIGLPFLNQNQLGGKFGGPILKNKLLFYTNYEAFRVHQQTTGNRTILTNDARSGIFTYEDTANNVRKVNLLNVTGRSIDPVIRDLIGKMPDGSAINNFRVGDSRETLLRNTAGYSLRVRDNRIRDNFTSKVDYILSSTNTIVGTYLWNRDFDDRADIDTTFNVVPTAVLKAPNSLLSVAWRSNPRPTLTNEARFGFNVSRPKFSVDRQDPQFFVSGLIFTNPTVTFMGQGRDVDTYNFSDNVGWMRGKHNFQFGYQGMLQRISPFNDAGIIGTYGLAIGAGQQGVSQEVLPGIRANDVTAANNMLATLAGLVNSYTQTYNVKDRTSGFVPGQTNLRRMPLDTHAIYFGDTWKVKRNLTLNLGLRYEYMSVLDEKDSLFLLPQLVNGNAIQSLFINNTLEFAGKSAGRPWYKSDKNNFGPNIGLAWDVFGNGKLAIRSGFSTNFVNDSHATAVRNTVTTNEGLSATSQGVGLSGTLSNGRPPIPTPAYKVPRTFEDNWRINPTAAFAITDPNLVTPYVNQWNLSVQYELFGGVLDTRYVANKVTQALRAFDYNQVVIGQNGFLADFKRAQTNGNAALAATGVFNPAYSAAIAGSQPLPVFDRLSQGGTLTNATVRNLIQTGQVGQLGEYYQTQRLNCADATCINRTINFFTNPLALGLNMMTNYSNQSYHSVQFDWAKRFKSGWGGQFNYTYGKVMSDTAGTEQAQFEPFLDLNSGKLERARTPFDVTHAIKANFIYELPFGAGKRLAGNRVMNRIIGGWSLSGVMTYQSGSPFSIQSLRGTLNRSARSGGQNGSTAVTNVTKDKLDSLIGFRMTGNGPFYINSSALGTDGRGVAADGRAPFDGQVFFNPNAGEWGGLQRRMFSGPWWFNFDSGLVKSTKISDRYSFELRMEAINLFNTPTFYIGDQDINSVNFMRVTSTNTTPRRLQFSASFRF